MTNDATPNEPRKPRLLFFQYQYDPGLPEFLLIHKRDHVNCLSTFFDVTVIDRDCDYEEVCETYQPDLALFESGVNHSTCRRPRIRNVRRCAQVPKAALHNADGFCNARAGFLSDLEHLGIDTIFAISTTAAEHTPEIADRLFAWPNAIDPATFHDYGLWKSIPVLLTGNTDRFYPWRQRVFARVSERFPSMMCPHPGYDRESLPAQILTGERYARMINASYVVPTCGTVAHEVVRKHFEIPACRTALLTERSPGLEAAGFVDMENCIFADAGDVVDKLQHLFRNPDQLQRITDRGSALVHQRHTFQQRGQIVQWYQLQAALQPGQRIIQHNPFGPLAVVDRSGPATTHVAGRGIHLQLLRTGDELFAAGRIEEAERQYVQCMQYMRWMPEPRLRTALCRLLQGDARGAHALLVEPIQFVLGSYGAADPDPVEWAYYLIALVGLREDAEAQSCAAEYGWLRHPELDRARLLVSLLQARPRSSLFTAGGRRRATLHQLPEQNWVSWLARACRMLTACGRSDLAARAWETGRALPADVQGGATAPDIVLGSQPPEADLDRYADPPAKSTLVFKRRLRRQELLRTARRVAARNLHRVETYCGSFLPYRYSESRRDDLFAGITARTKAHDIGTALILGTPDPRCVEAILDGMTGRPADRRVFCVGPPTREQHRLARAYAGRVTCVDLEGAAAARRAGSDLVSMVDRTVEGVEHEHGIHRWDAVLVDGGMFTPESNAAAAVRAMAGAQLIVLTGLDIAYMFARSQELLQDAVHVLAAFDPGHRSGYAIFAMRGAEAMAPAARVSGAVLHEGAGVAAVNAGKQG